ncbi:MAG: hypothetical protein CMJ84_16575 [Planctomycetes bacterium]|jgi:hypothetical protein|nr:hypothetical protein [Planctomycetota bacterium]MDP6409941.1 multiheme c-type cytochrome [Planctomycetota bacterium]
MNKSTLWRPIAIALLGSLGLAALIDTTLRDFALSGTQAGSLPPGRIQHSDACEGCHGWYDIPNAPYNTWQGSLMANAGRDPLFWAQMATANQDVEGVGYYCLRCHVPMSFTTGHALQPDGSTIDDLDRDGVTCHLCHTMVDPIYRPGVSPQEDLPILAALESVPAHYGNAMFVLDPSGMRRGPYDNASTQHRTLQSPFHREGEMCGTCHDVGNVAISLQDDGSYAYNALNAPPPSEDAWEQFPLERTYTEWKLSEFESEGVDMGGLFGGVGDPVMSTCQDCHMPKTVGDGCWIGPTRRDLARHEFAGASAWVLEIIALYYVNDPLVDQIALETGRRKAIEMVERAATLDLRTAGDQLAVRVTNQAGHKIPTGHIEGRRIFLNVKVYDAEDRLLVEYGHYDYDSAHLDEDSTVVYEMKVGLSAAAAEATGLPEGVTTHMALADTIEKDNRIPPRGFDNARFARGGAPVIGANYADGQYWDDAIFDLPDGAARAEATLHYQTVTRHYIEALRDGNVTDHWGDTLHRLWLQTNKCPPIEITSGELLLP